MSGGHFGEYDYYKVHQFADELKNEIENNYVTDEYGHYRGYSKTVTDLLEKQIPTLLKAAELMRHIDYLYAGDHGEDSFIERIKETEEKFKDS